MFLLSPLGQMIFDEIWILFSIEIIFRPPSHRWYDTYWIVSISHFNILSCLLLFETTRMKNSDKALLYIRNVAYFFIEYVTYVTALFPSYCWSAPIYWSWSVVTSRHFVVFVCAVIFLPLSPVVLCFSKFLNKKATTFIGAYYLSINSTILSFYHRWDPRRISEQKWNVQPLYSSVFH